MYRPHWMNVGENHQILVFIDELLFNEPISDFTKNTILHISPKVLDSGVVVPSSPERRHSGLPAGRQDLSRIYSLLRIYIFSNTLIISRKPNFVGLIFGFFGEPFRSIFLDTCKNQVASGSIFFNCS